MTDALLDAIVANDRQAVKAILKADRQLAGSPIQQARLFQRGILHWLYVRDTPLHLAAAGHRAGLVRLLLAAGADPCAAANHRRGTPLHYAADGVVTWPDYQPDDQVETIRSLLDGGAEIDVQDKNGATALHRAVRTRCARAVEFLLSAGADPTVKNHSGSTPFHLAVQNTGRGGSGQAVAVAAQRTIIQLFLDRGTSTRVKDGSGKSVRDCARSGWVRQMLG